MTVEADEGLANLVDEIRLTPEVAQRAEQEGGIDYRPVKDRKSVV